MESFDELADEVGALENRVSDVIFDAVREQMRGSNAESAKDLERQLAKVRRSLMKAEYQLRHMNIAEDSDDD